MRKSIAAALIGLICGMAVGAAWAVTGTANDLDGKAACQKAVADFKSKAQGKSAVMDKCKCIKSNQNGQIYCRVEEKH